MILQSKEQEFRSLFSEFVKDYFKDYLTRNGQAYPAAFQPNQ